MANNSLVVEVNFNQGDAPAPTEPNQSIPTPTEARKNVKSSPQHVNMIRGGATRIGYMALNDAVGQVGNYTGQRGLQVKIDNTMKYIGYGSALAGGALAGGGVGLGIATAYVAYDVVKNGLELRRSNREEEQRRQYYREFVVAINHGNRNQGAT